MKVSSVHSARHNLRGVALVRKSHESGYNKVERLHVDVCTVPMQSVGETKRCSRRGMQTVDADEMDAAARRWALGGTEQCPSPSREEQKEKGGCW